MFKSSFGHTTSREYSNLILIIICMYISRMANYKYKKNTQETAMETKLKIHEPMDWYVNFMLVILFFLA